MWLTQFISKRLRMSRFGAVAGVWGVVKAASVLGRV
jgi:hypothetical protein